MWNFFKPKKPVIKIRPWETKDIPLIMTLENQWDEVFGEPQPITRDMLAKWIIDDQMYGIVLTENGIVRGYAAVFPPKIQRVIIHLLRVDKNRRKHGYGTLMLNHFFYTAAVWGKSCLSIDISERNEPARKFLMRGGLCGFVIVALSEFLDENGDFSEAFYEMQCPAPHGFQPHDMRIFVNGTEIERNFKKCP
jgi:GNAT superfamily N-acetyltransferase